MEAENLKLWNEVADIDPAHTKPITGKDYKGTSPNPQYMVMLATEKLGPVGKGFGWNVIDDGIQAFGETSIHFCRIRFWWKDGDEIREYENYGQTKMAYKTQSGYIKVDEDAPKKSMTDAIVKCLSHLGFAANIFLGRWDDSGYVDGVKEEFDRKKDPEEFERRQKAKQDEDARRAAEARERKEREEAKRTAAEAEAKAKATAAASHYADDVVSRLQIAADNVEAASLLQEEQAKIARVKAGYPELFKRIEVAAKAAGAEMREAA